MTQPVEPNSQPSAVSKAGHLNADVVVDHLRLSDGLITLDPLRSSDAEVHFSGEDEELQRWLSGGQSTHEGVVAYLSKVERQWESRGPVFHFAIRAEPHLHLAGTIDLQFDQPYARKGQVNLAYGIYPQWRRRGFAAAAVSLASRFLRDCTDAREALIRTEPANLASARVAERAGFAVVPQQASHGGMTHFERVVRR